MIINTTNIGTASNINPAPNGFNIANRKFIGIKNIVIVISF